MTRRTLSLLVVLSLGINLALGAVSTSNAQLPSIPVPPSPTGPVPARVAFDSVQESLPAAYYGYHAFTVYDATNTPLYGQYSRFTAVVAGVNGPKTIEGYLDYWGRGIFGYYGQNVGADDLTVTVGPATGTAARTYGANAGSLPQPNTSAPARVTFDAAAQSLPAPWYGYHGFSVADAQGQPVYGQYSSFTAVVAGTSGPITINGKLDYYGRGTIGYYATQSGADTITVTVGAATGEAARTYGANTQPPANPIPPLPPVPNPPTGPVPARVVFDETSRSDPAPWFGYHGFSVLDAQGNPLWGQYSRFTATVQGVNGPLTFEGYLDYYGRGVFSYYAQRAGADTLTVSVGPAAGEATRTYGVSNPSLPQANERPAARVEFDSAAQTLPSPWYGYHGFTVYDAQGMPVYGRYLQFTAVVAGPNGPLTINGQLDYYGRGTIGYWADKPGADTITVNAGSANGSAARTYAPNVHAPPVGIPPLPPLPPAQAPPVNPSQVARIAFDDPAAALPSPWYGCHSFTAYDLTGTPTYGTYRQWTATVAGVNGPLTVSGSLDYWARGIFCYYASRPGADALNVTVEAGTGAAKRTYVVAAGPPPLPGLGVPSTNEAQPALVTFDNAAQTLPATWYGCHGFTATDATATPLYGTYRQFTAVVAGANGPHTVGGRLDYWARGTICYSADVAGVDTITVNVGAAAGEAARTYAPDFRVPSPPLDMLPSGDPSELPVPAACTIAATFCDPVTGGSDAGTGGGGTSSGTTADWQDSRCEQDGNALASTSYCTPPTDQDAAQPPIEPDTCEGAEYCELSYGQLEATEHGDTTVMREEDTVASNSVSSALAGTSGTKYGAWVSFYLYKSDEYPKKCKGTVEFSGFCGWTYHKYKTIIDGVPKPGVTVTAFAGASANNNPADKWKQNVGPVPNRYKNANGVEKEHYRWGRMNGKFTGYEKDERDSFYPGKWRLDSWTIYKPSNTDVSRSAFEIHGGRNADGSSRLDTTMTQGCVRLRIRGIRALKAKWDNKTSNKKKAEVYVRYKQ